MLEGLIQADRSLFSLLNGAHVPWLDPVMVFFSKTWVWLPLYVGIAVGLFWTSRGGTQRASRVFFGLSGLVALLLCFAICDRLGAFGKDFFERLRPCWDPELSADIHLLEKKGSRYGFPSNHAANAFGLAVLSAAIFRRRLYTVLILLWAAVVAYSRIYVGKHFPLDVCCGALLGIVVALAMAWVLRRWCSSARYKKWLSSFKS